MPPARRVVRRPGRRNTGRILLHSAILPSRSAVEAVQAIARAVPQCVEGLGFFVDRRRFRPMMALATVATSTTGPLLDAVVGALESFRGEEWTVDAVSLLRLSYGEGTTDHAGYRSIAVGPA